MINQNLLLTGDDGYNLTNSLRFRQSASAYLSRTPASASGENQWTFSTWVKRSILTSEQYIIGGNTTTSGGVRNVLSVLFDSNNNLQVYAFTNASGYYFQRVSSAVYRDPSAWYHLVVQFDPDNATSANRIIAYINGQQVSWGTSSDSGAAGSISSSAYRSINNTYRNDINGGYQGGGAPIYFGDGYLAETIMVSGSLVSVSSFGETSTTTGVWIPKKYTGTYGTNGFYLPFTDNSALTTSSNVGLGKDFSGNANYWTTNNISITAGSTYDSMTDVPTLTSATAANYCTLNPVLPIPSGTISQGNLNYLRGSTGSHGSAGATFAMPTTGKWYWEVTACSSVNNEVIGVANILNNPQLPTAGSEIGGGSRGDYAYRSDGNKYNNGNQGAYGATYTNGDVIGVAWNSDSGTITFYKNGTSQGTAFSSITQVDGKFVAASSNAESSNGDSYNFGQRPFAYTPPTGFNRLNTFNLPTPTIGATAATTANKYFNATLYTGNGTSQSIVNSGSMQPDLVWYKSRSSGVWNHGLFDSVRGTTKQLFSNNTGAENTFSGVTAFNSNGFSVGSDNGGNENGGSMVAWQWRAGQGTTSNITVGQYSTSPNVPSIASTVSANTTAGFSIVTWTGNAASSATIGHGLGVAPSMIIVKNRSATWGWFVYNKFLTNPNTGRLQLNLTNGEIAGGSPGSWNNTAPTSTVFSLGDSTFPEVNGSGNSMVAYCFAPVTGYSAFGSYTGNGSTDGTFVYTGFRPRFVLIKVSSGTTGNWTLVDTSRNPYNVMNSQLNPDASDAEFSGSNIIDAVSNGFKLRNTPSAFNGSGNTYIYMAFAETPFKYANAR